MSDVKPGMKVCPGCNETFDLFAAGQILLGTDAQGMYMEHVPCGHKGRVGDGRTDREGKCPARAASCLCGLVEGHQGDDGSPPVHECEEPEKCGGAWTGEWGTDSFSAVRLPTPLGGFSFTFDVTVPVSFPTWTKSAHAPYQVCDCPPPAGREGKPYHCATAIADERGETCMHPIVQTPVESLGQEVLPSTPILKCAGCQTLWTTEGIPGVIVADLLNFCGGTQGLIVAIESDTNLIIERV